MPSHWTYTDCCPEDDLEQGDIILPTEQLKSLFARVHQHFCDPKYVGFVVLTQSCDLVRRDDGVCKAKHITLAVVRELHYNYRTKMFGIWKAHGKGRVLTTR